jgi:hypothetical protein
MGFGMGTPFVIIAAPRTGSNWLCSQLRAQPDIWCHGEVFHPKRVWIKTSTKNQLLDHEEDAEWRALRDTDRDKFLKRVFDISLERPHVGFKIFPGHGDDEDFRLAGEQSLKKIILFRSNFLAVHASRIAAERTGAFSVAEMRYSKRPAVEFNGLKFSRDHAKYSAYYLRILERLVGTGQSFHFIRYDEINAMSSLLVLLQFIGATAEVVSIPKPAVRGSSDILSRFSNPEVAERYLREHGLMHWAHEADTSSGGVTA